MRRAGYITLIVLSLGVSGYAVVVYGFLPPGAAVHPDMLGTFAAHDPRFLYAHVFASVFALVLGPFQFSARLRSARKDLHRWSGRLYLGIGILVGGSAGFAVALNAYGGPVARVGFACLAAAWLFTGWKAYRAIRGRDVESHRRWMVRNFALTLAAVTLRLWLPALIVAGMSFAAAYPVIAWLCWVPNLLAAELLFNRPQSRGVQPAPVSGRG